MDKATVWCLHNYNLVLLKLADQVSDTYSIVYSYAIGETTYTSQYQPVPASTSQYQPEPVVNSGRSFVPGESSINASNHP
jgi:hypothetical protein